MLFSHHNFGELCLIALFALLLNLLFGIVFGYQLHRLRISPANLWKYFLLKAEHKMNRKKRNAYTRARRGTLIAMLAASVLLLLGATFSIIFLMPSTQLAEIILLSLFLQAGQAYNLSVKAGRAVKQRKKGNLKLPASIPSFLLRRRLASYDDGTLIRATIEFLAIRLYSGLIAPITFYIAFGWPGLLLINGLRLMDQLVGYKSEQLKSYGSSTAFLHQLLNYIPARITAFFITIAAFFSPRGKPVRAFFLMLKEGSSRLQSSNNGWPLCAMAGSFSLSLGGPRRIRNYTIADQWVGNGISQTKRPDLIRVQWCYIISVLLVALALSIAAGENNLQFLLHSLTHYYPLGLNS